MFKNSSAKYYHKIKKTTKKAPERYQSLSKEEKEKINDMVVNNTKIYQKMKSRSLFC